jgi:hypothetical protein
MKTTSSRWSAFRLCASVMFATLISMAGVTEAFAATGTVNVTNTGTGIPTSGCGLQEAVAALNAGVNQNGCTISGGGPNIVVLPAGTYTINSRLAPTVNMTIKGNTVSNTIIQVSSGFPAGSLVFVETNGTAREVTLRDLTLRRNPSSPPPSVCGVEVQGHFDPNNVSWAGPTVNLERTRITGFDRSGIRSFYGSMTIKSSRIDGNTSPDDGGGAYIFADSSSNRTLGIDNSLFQNNVAHWSGGALYFSTGSSHIRASTFAGNNATWGAGGAIYATPASFNAYLQIMHDTIAGNSASIGGGIYSAYSVGDSRFTVSRSIIANNSGQSGWDIAGYVDDEATLWSSHDDECVASHRQVCTTDTPPVCVNDMVGVDPLLGGLMDLGGNGIPTFPLWKGSPALDYALPGGFTSSDQRGFPLQMDSLGGNSSTRVDIGAYEHGPWQTELLTMVATSTSDSHSVFSNSSLSNGQGTLLQANATNDYVTYRLPVFETGTYAVKLGGYRTTGSGRAKLQWSNTQSGWTDIGTAQEFYSSTSGAFEAALPSVNLNTIGQKYFRLLVTGKSSSSSTYAIRVDYIKLIKS